MNKKLMMVLLVFAIATATIGVVSAAETFTVNGIDFNMPDGYFPYDSGSGSDSSNNVTDMEIITNGENIVMVIVVDNSTGNLTSDIKEPGDVEKTIAGKKGYINTTETSTIFKYAEGKKIVMIGSTVNNETLFETVIGK